MGHFCPPGSGSGSIDPIESGSNPDPQPCLGIVLLKQEGVNPLGQLWVLGFLLFSLQILHRFSRRMEFRFSTHLDAALWNHNYYLRFRFRLLKSYGSGSYFWKVTVTVPVPAPYLDHKKQIFQTKIFEFFLPFYIKSCFTRIKFINFNKFIVKYEWTKF